MIKGILIWVFDQLNFRRRTLVLWLLLCLTLLSLVQCYQHKAAHTPHGPSIIYAGDRLIIPKDSSLRSVVTLKTVQRRLHVSHLTLPAVIQAIPANVLNVYTPLSGQIQSLPKKLGDKISQGEVLYTLTSPDLAQAIADKIDAEAAYQLAQKTLKRQQELIHYNIGPMHNLQTAENEAVRALVELKRAQTRLAALHVQQDDQNVTGELVVRSPIDGIVASINAGLGAYWSDLTTPVMSIVNISQVYAMAAIQESDVSAISLGQSVEVILDSHNKTYPAKVAWMSPILDPNTRTLNVGVLLDNMDYFLRPNMFARAKFSSKPREMIVLPITAVIQRGFDSIVFVEVAPWEFKARIVTVGTQIGNYLEIKSGLSMNERVATTGGIILND